MVATLDAAAPFQALNKANVGFGAATLWLSPVGTALPADTVNMGDDWRSTVAAWAPVGASDSGVTYGSTPQTVDLSVEEDPMPAAVLVDTLDFPVNVTMAEDLIANVRIAIGLGTLATQAAGASPLIGKTTLTLGVLPIQFALGVEHVNPLGHWRRVSVPTVVSVSQITVSNRRAAEKRMYVASFRAICPIGSIKITEKTAESTS